MTNFKPKVCVICGAVFTPKSSTSKVCGEECRKAKNVEYNAKYNADPEVKARRVEHNAKYYAEYNADPEVKARRAEYYAEYNANKRDAKRFFQTLAMAGGAS